MKFLKLLLSAFIMLLLGYISWLNIKLYYRPVYSNNVNQDLMKQWQFVKTKMHNDEDRKMQQLFPEGYMFMNALHGITSAELATTLQNDAYKDVYLEGYRCYLNMNSQEARNIFAADLLLPYGAYYNGWSAYQMSKLLQAERGAHDNDLQQDFEKRCQAIATAMQRQQTPYLESYHRFAWPADMMLCVAALAEHDKLYQPLYKATIDTWVTQVKQHLDPWGMLPHSVNYLTSEPAENARGSSMSLMLCFLKSINEPFYRQQFALYNKYFLANRFGLPGIYEYPWVSDGGSGDSDSGPVILGVGGSASIVGVRAFAAAGKAPVAISLRNSIEAFGMATQSTGKKKYLFGALPMADAFIAWAIATELTPAQELNTGEHWRIGFQLYSLLLYFTGLMVLWRIWRKIPI